MTRLALLGLVAALGLAACGSMEEPEATPQAESEPTGLPDVARIACKSDGPPVVETPAIKPQADGVHLEIVNETGAELTLVLPTLGTGAPKGTSTQIVDLGPGELTVACRAADDLAEVEPPAATLEVVDQDGVWVSDVLACPEQFSQVNDYAVDARGETSDPLEAARKALAGYGLEPNDVLERAGYPAADGARVRLVRDGETLAVVLLVDDGTGKWLVGGLNGCSSLQGSPR
jgi:hypothetical protein